MKQNFALQLSLTLLALIFSISFSLAQYSGSYTVGGDSPDFTSLQEAADSLASQGIFASVILNLRDGDYNENVQFNTIAGISSTSTLTVQSESADASSVVIFSANSNPPVVETFVPHMRFNNLTLRFTGGNSWNSVLQLYRPQDIEIEGCIIEKLNPDATGYPVYSATEEEDIIDITINDCNISGGYFGVYLVSYSDIVDNIQISSSVINSGYGVYIESQEDASSISLLSTTINASIGTGLEVYSDNGNVYDVFFQASAIESLNDGIAVYTELGGIYDVTLQDAALVTGGYGIYANAYENVENFSILETDISSFSSCVEVSAEFSIVDLFLDEVTMSTDQGYGMFLHSENTSISGLQLTNSEATSSSSALYIASEFDIDSVLISSVSLESEFGNAAYLNSDAGDVSQLEINSSTLHGVDYEGGAGLTINAGGNINSVVLNENSFDGSYGMDFYSFLNQSHVSMMDNEVGASFGTGIESYASNGDISDFTVEGLSIETADGTGITFESQGGKIDNCSFSDLTINASYDGATFSSNNGGIHDVSFDEALISSEFGKGIEFNANNCGISNIHINHTTSNTSEAGEIALNVDAFYGNVESIWVENSTFSSNLECCNEVVSVANIEGSIKDVQFQNNHLVGSSGLAISASSGEVNSTLIKDCEFEVNNEGIRISALGNTCEISNNMVTQNQSGFFYTGITVEGNETGGNDILIKNNEVLGALGQAIQVYNQIWDVEISGNRLVTQQEGGELTMIHVSDVLDGTFVINGNEIIVTETYAEGIYLNQVDITSLKKGRISNNFISGTNYGIRGFNVNNVDITHNSLNLWEFGSALNLFTSEDIGITNNIFCIGEETNYVYDFSSAFQTDRVDHNVVCIDTNSSDLAYISNWQATYNGLGDWRSTFGLDTNSFYYTPQFVNDTTNLHIKCTDTDLNAGSYDSQIPTDIDGHVRRTLPTIGADEILSDENIFSYGPQSLCEGDTILLDAGYVFNASYEWSNGDTTQEIFATLPGEYWVVVSDDCGEYEDELTIESLGPEASFTHITSFLTAVFENTSADADSAFWDFGDGTTSDAFNPFHIYEEEGIYNVVLEAFNACGSSITSAQVTISLVGIEEKAMVQALSLFPNPSSDLLSLSLVSNQESILQLELRTVAGRKVFEEVLQVNPGQNREDLSLRDVPSGIYMLQIIAGEQRITRRVVKI